MERPLRQSRRTCLEQDQYEAYRRTLGRSAAPRRIAKARVRSCRRSDAHTPNHDRPTRFARALQELGRLIKTLYFLRFIDDEAYRRRILIQLNRGEGRHQLARTNVHGKRGELRQRYREGQEDQLGALGLVVNLVVLWNTIYMDAALNQLKAKAMRSNRKMSRACHC